MEDFKVDDIQLRFPYSLGAPEGKTDVNYNLDYAFGLNYAFNPHMI